MGLTSSHAKVIHLLDLLLQATRLQLSYTIQSNPGAVPELTVEFSGGDLALLLARNGELLQAMEHLGAKVCGLEPQDHDLLLMEAGQFKARREAALMESASRAALQVRETGASFTFQPMSSHERRRLHLALAGSGLHTESVGTGAQRSVVLHPPRDTQAEA